MTIAEKYLPHIEKLIDNPEVSEFAKKVYDKSILLINEQITYDEFDDGDYLIVFDSEFEHTKAAKNSINYIKRSIANERTEQTEIEDM